MNLSQWLSRLPTERMEAYMAAPVWQASSERGMTWSEAACDQQSVSEALALLTEHAAQVIKAMLRIFGASPAEGERLLNEVRRHTLLSGSECSLGLRQLEEAGILLAVRKVWGERIYSMPSECFVAWHRALFPGSIQPLPGSARERILEAGAVQLASRPLGRQLLAAFALLARHGMELTSKGVLAKKTIAKLAESLDLDDQWLRQFELKWAHQEHYPLKVAFMLEAGQALGILNADQDRMSWNRNRLTDWLLLKEGEREEQLLAWVCGLLLPSAGAAARIAAELHGLLPGRWYSAEDINRSLTECQFGSENAKVSILLGSKLDWFALLHSLGWMELAEISEHGARIKLFRWKPFTSAADSKLAIQPNGEIYADSGCSFAIRWELELISECKRDEGMAIYQLTSSSVAAAVEHGRTKQSILQFLLSASEDGAIPPTVEAMLEEWTSRACRTEFSEVVLLRCSDAEAAERVRSHSGIAPLLLQSLGDRDFIVDPSQLGEIRRLLQKAGYPPRKGMVSSNSVVSASYPRVSEHAGEPAEAVKLMEVPAIRSTPAFVYGAYPLHHFEIAELPTNNKVRLLPELDKIPTMWTKQLRTYHHSTRKEMLERALQWQTPVQLTIEQEVQSFIPEKLEQQGEEWAVIGLLRDRDERRSIRLTPDMWDEMRIVIPNGLAP